MIRGPIRDLPQKVSQLYGDQASHTVPQELATSLAEALDAPVSGSAMQCNRTDPAPCKSQSGRTCRSCPDQCPLPTSWLLLLANCTGEEAQAQAGQAMMAPSDLECAGTRG